MSHVPAPPRPPSRALLLPAALLLSVACSDAFTLPPATQETSEHTPTLYALTGTPVNTPSAYNLITLSEIRTDRTSEFDFVFDIGADTALGVGTLGASVAVLLPRGAVGLGIDGGLQVSAQPFDSILLAPETGYQDATGVVVDSGTVLLVASRKQNCNFGFIRPRYAKARVERLDLVQRTITLRMVVNPNCGYRGLGPGVPRQ